MKRPIAHPDFTGREFHINEGGMLHGPSLWIDGAELQEGYRPVNVTDNEGRSRSVCIKEKDGFVGVMITVDGEEFVLTQPISQWALCWIFIPLLPLIILGGGLGAVIGMIAVVWNRHIFYSERTTLAKYSITGFAVICAYVLHRLGAVGLYLLITTLWPALQG